MTDIDKARAELEGAPGFNIVMAVSKTEQVARGLDSHEFQRAVRDVVSSLRWHIARVANLETHIVMLREAQTRNVEGVVRERDEARRDFAACAHAIGVEHVQDFGPSAPGPVEAVVGHIEEAARHAGEAVDLRARVAELEGALSEQAASHDDPVWSRLDALAKDADGVWSKLRLQADRAGWERAMASVTERLGALVGPPGNHDDFAIGTDDHDKLFDALVVPYEPETTSGDRKPLLTVRSAARGRQPLGGADAQALEYALTMTERERDALIAVQCEDRGDDGD